MNCLVSQYPLQITGSEKIGDPVGLQVDIGQEISSFIQANPIPSIGLAVAIGFALYSLFK